MNIGILSMQRVANYGSILQAFALKNIIENLGHEVQFVDYLIESPIVEEVRSESTTGAVSRVKRKVQELFMTRKAVRMTEYQEYWKFHTDYTGYLRTYLNIGKERNVTPALDVLVIGSDEVFNCLQSNPEVGYSLQLFGKDAKADKIITYAASFGNTTYQKLEKFQVEKEIGQLLNRMDALSLRDQNSVSIAEKLTARKAEYHIDPVMLYDFELEEHHVNIHDYIVVYAYASRLTRTEARMIRKFAKKKNKKIICLGGPQDYLNGYQNVSPIQVLELIKNADYVITETFHGTVFSIKFQKKFAVIVRNSGYGNNEKVTDLLNRFDLQSRITVGGQFEDILNQEIDYLKVGSRMAEERIKSMEYLTREIQASEK